MKKKCNIFLGIILFILSLTGCNQSKPAEPAAASYYEGASIYFEYDIDKWNLSKTTDNSGHEFITAYNPDSRALLTMIAVDGLTVDPQNYYKEFRAFEDEDDMMDEDSDQTEADDVVIDSFYYEKDDSIAGKESYYYFYARCYQFDDGQTILAAAECNQEEELTDIKQILDTLKLSEETEIKGLSVSKDREKTLVRTMQDYLRSIEKKTAKAELDKAFKEAGDYDILREVELLGRDNTAHKILVPETDNYDGEFYSYREHGIEIFVSWSYDYLDTLEEYLEEELSYTREHYKEYVRDYQNINELEMVVNGDFAYQIIETERSHYLGGFEPYISIFYEKILPDENMLHMSIVLSAAEYDNQTNQILAELAAEYQLPLEAYQVDANDLTYGGERVNSGQEVYQQRDNDSEVLPIEGLPLIGTLSFNYNDQEFTVMVPRGRETRPYSTSVMFNMYGISGTAGVDRNYEQRSCADFARKALSYIHSYDQSNSVMYKAVSDISVISSTESYAIAAFTEIKVERDASEHLVYRVCICREIGNGYLETTELEMNTKDFSRETDELLKQYSTALGIDLTEIQSLAAEPDPLPEDTEEL